MELLEKLSILADAAKYDVACTSSGSTRQNTSDVSIGNALKGGICHSFTADGRCVSLLKILFSNYCSYDCEYCINRKSNDIKRASFTPKEVAYLTIEFYKRNYIEGLFLSSAVVKTPDNTMEMIKKTIMLLRYELNFNGYIHVKVIPGTDPILIDEIGCIVDRMSVNVELPSKKSLQLLAPDKKPKAVFEPMKNIHDKIMDTEYSFKRGFVPAGQSTQMIIGATPDTDFDILMLSEKLYDRYKLKRVFYSAYIPVVKSSLLPAIIKPELKREHRLYQADWLLRFYGFKASELLNQKDYDLNMDLDPKCDWALRNISYFPVEINNADYYQILRVPGIGTTSARKIVQARRTHSLTFESLTKMRVVMKRAKYFITCNGKMFKGFKFDQFSIKTELQLAERPLAFGPKYEQISIFDDYTKALTGEI